MTRGSAMLAAMSAHRAALGPHDDTDGAKFAVGGVEMLLRHMPDDGDGELVDLLSIETASKGAGAGTAALYLLCREADRHGVRLSCYARAMDSKPASTARVVRWYERHGFTICGDNFEYWDEPDAEDADHMGCDMFREPCQPVG